MKKPCDFKAKDHLTKCPVCQKSIKMNLAIRKTTRPILCYKCYQKAIR